MKAIEKTKDYQVYATYKINQIPGEIFNKILNLVLIEASRNMGGEFNDKMLDAIIETIQENHYYLPLSYIVSAIYKGSMGIYGPGRLIPRNIFSWMRETSMEYNKEVEHKQIEERLKPTDKPVDLKRYPMGSALIKKIEWLTSGAIDGDDYDKIDLKVLAEMIGFGQQPTLEDFNLINRNQC